jgi:hypothetical protein
LAGNLRNWPLAEYQLSQMRATLHDCRVLFPNVAVADTSAISRSAEEFRDAIRTKDGVKFDAAFQKFTAECNNCHKGAGLEFIKIRVPVTSPIMTSPLSNESFAPDQVPAFITESRERSGAVFEHLGLQPTNVAAVAPAAAT